MKPRSVLDNRYYMVLQRPLRAKWFQVLALAFVIFISFIPSSAQIPVLESLSETISARWDFQKEFPLATQLYSGAIQDQDCAKLIQHIRAARPTPMANPESPTFADLWADFTVGLAREKIKSGEGENDFKWAAQMAKGNIGVNYELARIMVQARLPLRARSFQMETHKSMLEKGYIKVAELAKLELYYSRQAMDKDDFQLARQHAEFAARLDPFCPWVPLMLLEMEIRSTPFFNLNLGEVWIHLLDAASLLRYYETQSIFILNVLRGLRFGLGIFGGVVLLVLMGRYFTRIAHMPAERLPHDVDLWIRYLALALIPVSLAIGGIGYAVVALLLIMLLWKYTSKHEKAFLRTILLGLALIPMLLVCEQSLVRYTDDTEGIHHYHLAYLRGFESPNKERLDQFKPRKNEDRFYQNLAKSVAYKKQGNFIKAREYADTAQSLDPASPRAILNQGNLFMMTFEYSKAAKIYGQLRNLAPDWVETWFNSSQAELYSNNSSAHKKFLDRAAEEDALWVTQFLKDNDENFPQYTPNRKVMDPMLRNGQAWLTSLNSLLDLDFLKVRLSMGVYSIPGGGLILAVALTSFLLYLRFRQYHHHVQGRTLFDCKICGKVMCRTCRKGVHCQTCFKMVSGIQDNRMKLEMVSRIRGKSTLLAIRIGSVLNTLLPGSGYLYLGLGGMRFAWTFVSCLMLGGLWQSCHLLMEYPVFVLGPLQGLLWLPVVILYGVFNLKMWRSPIEMSKVVIVTSPNEKVGML